MSMFFILLGAYWAILVKTVTVDWIFWSFKIGEKVVFYSTTGNRTLFGLLNNWFVTESSSYAIYDFTNKFEAIPYPYEPGFNVFRPK